MEHLLSQTHISFPVSPHQPLKGKLITVTGAASGIGRATAILLAGRGAILGLADIQLEPLQALADKLRASGAKVFTSVVDVADRTVVETWIETLVKDAGRPLDGAVK